MINRKDLKPGAHFNEGRAVPKVIVLKIYKETNTVCVRFIWMDTIQRWHHDTYSVGAALRFFEKGFY